MPWEFVVANAAGVPLGTLDKGAYDRSVRIPLNAARTCSFRVRHDHPLADVLLAAPAVLVKAYDPDGVLRFVGPVVTAQEASTAPGASISVTCADPSWRLGKRLIGKSVAGFNMGTALAPVALGSIAQAIVDAVNGDGETGLAVGSVATTATGFVGPWNYKPAYEAIAEISGTLDGFDWRVDPLEPAGGKYGTFYCADAIGSIKPNAVYEYGTGKRNVSSYTRAINADALANSVYALPPSGDVGTVQNATDAASIAAYGLFEDVASNDLAPDAMRLQLAQEHVEVRRNGRQTIEFQPSAIADPKYGTDFDVGDVVEFRAKIDDRPRIDVLSRVYAIQFDIDSEGRAVPTVTVSPS